MSCQDSYHLNRYWSNHSAPRERVGCCITGEEDGCISIRVVNTVDTQEILRRGEALDKMEPGIKVSIVQPGVLAACCEGTPFTQGMISNELTSQQRESLLTTLQQLQTVFFTKNPLPFVKVGVEQAVRTSGVTSCDGESNVATVS